MIRAWTVSADGLPLARPGETLRDRHRALFPMARDVRNIPDFDRQYYREMIELIDDDIGDALGSAAHWEPAP